jgi:HEAT repeat protein
MAIVALLGCAAMLAGGQAPAAPTAADIEQAVAAAGSYDYGQSRAALAAVDKLVNATHGNPALRAAIEKEMVKLLGSSAKFGCKQEICRRLWIIGTDASVPALGQMLADADGKVAEAACFALSRHPSPVVGKALRDALSQAQGAGLIAVIRLLGDRRAPECVDALAALTTSPDAATSAAAVTALGAIATPPGVKALAALHSGDRADRRAAASHALLQAGQELAARGQADEAKAAFEQLAAAAEPPHIRRGAFLGRVRLGGPDAAALVLAALGGKDDALNAAAIASIPVLRGEKISALFAERLPQLPPAQQELLIAALADRGEASARPAIVQAAGHAELPVRVAAIKALGVLGDVSCVPLVIKACGAGGDEARIAGATLRLIRGEGVETAIVRAMTAAEPRVRAPLIRVLADRRCAEAAAAFLTEAASDDTDVCQAALEALGKVGGERELPGLIRLLVELKAETARAHAERALGQVVQQIADPSRRADAMLAALNTAKAPAARCSLLRVLGTVAGEKSYTAVVEAMRAGDAEVSDTAVRVLADWPDRRAQDVLLDLVRNTTVQPHRVLALRGYVRLLGQDKQRPAQETARLYAEVMGQARRPDEKKLVLAGLAGVAHPDALKTALVCLDDASIRSEACLATVAIARAVARPNRAQAKAALEKVLSASEDQNIRTQARTALDEIGKLP